MQLSNFTNNATANMPNSSVSGHAAAFAQDVSKASQAQTVERTALNTTPQTFTPQTVFNEQVSQLVNSRYLFELKRNQKKIIRGRKLRDILARDYSFEEFSDLPLSIQNLIKFDKAVSSAEILQFIEELDKSHEIYFRDFSYESIKFRALFEALGQLLEVEMQAGPNTFVPLSEGFDVKRKIKKVFVELKDKILDKIFPQANQKIKTTLKKRTSDE